MVALMVLVVFVQPLVYLIVIFLLMSYFSILRFFLIPTQIVATLALIRMAVMRQMVFPLSCWQIKIEENQMNNQKTCDEFVHFINEAILIFKFQMYGQSHSFEDYHKASYELHNLTNFITTYAPINESLLDLRPKSP